MASNSPSETPTPPPPPPEPTSDPAVDVPPDAESNGATLIPSTPHSPDHDAYDEEEDEDEEDDASTTNNNTTKKQKTLSSLSASTSAAAAAVPPRAKKPKKKNNNMWTKPTSRKGKKKPRQQQQQQHQHQHQHHFLVQHHQAAPSSSAPHDTVLITPVPRFPDRSDDSPDVSICLSRANKAEKVELSDDRLSAGSTKGYRMVRATRGVVDGAWYFEIKIVRLGETGHTRLGWTTEKGDLQAPVGYDANSYGYRDVDGSKVHRALREKYGEEGYTQGDVIGFYINLPDGQAYAPKPPHLVWYKGQRYTYPAGGKDDPPKVIPGSDISFFKNGVCQGVAYTDLFGGRYYPAASMYTLPNQPNCEVRFNFGPNFDCFPQDFGSRPVPRPMSEVPYHGYDGRVENVAANGQQEETSATADCQPGAATAPANSLAEEATAAAKNLAGETTAMVNELAKEVITTVNCPPVEMAVDGNGATDNATVVANGLPEETTATADGLTEETDVAANVVPE